MVAIRFLNGLTIILESYSITITIPMDRIRIPTTSSSTGINPPIILINGISKIPINNRIPINPAAAANPSGKVSFAVCSSNLPVRCFLLER